MAEQSNGGHSSSKQTRSTYYFFFCLSYCCSYFDLAKQSRANSTWNFLSTIDELDDIKTAVINGLSEMMYGSTISVSLRLE